MRSAATRKRDRDHGRLSTIGKKILFSGQREVIIPLFYEASLRKNPCIMIPIDPGRLCKYNPCGDGYNIASLKRCFGPGFPGS
jgi:hypothetical protein